MLRTYALWCMWKDTDCEYCQACHYEFHKTCIDKWLKETHRRLIIYPKGIKKGRHLSIYLESCLPAGLARNVKFFLSVINQTDSAKTIEREASHEFTASSRASGIPEMLSLDELKRANEGFLVNDTIIVEVEILEGGIAGYNNLCANILNMVKGQTSEEASSSSQGCLPSPEEITHAKKVLIESISYKFADIIEQERKIELKKAFSTLSRVPDTEKEGVSWMARFFGESRVPDREEAMSRVTKFFAEFDQTCEKYEAAQKDNKQAKAEEQSVGGQMMMFKRVADTMEPFVRQGLEIEREIAEYKRILQEKEASHAKIMEFLGSLSVPVHKSELRLDEANSNLKLLKTKKEEAQKKMEDIEKIWESLKYHSFWELILKSYKHSCTYVVLHLDIIA